MRQKKKIAVFSATGCHGCDETLLDIAFYLESHYSSWLEFSFWPYLLGSPTEELNRDEPFDICLFSGCIRTEHDQHLATKLREKSRIFVALGTCACFAGMPGLANLQTDDQQQENNKRAPTDLYAPALNGSVMPLCEIAEVDYYVPGCPPNNKFLEIVFQAILGGRLLERSISFGLSHLPDNIMHSLTADVIPPKGGFFAGKRTVCASCSRLKQEKQIAALRQQSVFQPNEERCLLEQGLPCLGIVTREGCGGVCTRNGFPCRGCYGKATSVEDPGIAWITAIGSMFEQMSDKEIIENIEKLGDLPGTLYRNNVASDCLLMRRKNDGKDRSTERASTSKSNTN